MANPRYFGVSYGSPIRRIRLEEYTDDEVVEATLTASVEPNCKRRHMVECSACGGVHHGLWCRYGVLLHLVQGEPMFHLTFQVISQELGRQCEESDLDP